MFTWRALRRYLFGDISGPSEPCYPGFHVFTKPELGVVYCGKCRNYFSIEDVDGESNLQ